MRTYMQQKRKEKREARIALAIIVLPSVVLLAVMLASIDWEAARQKRCGSYDLTRTFDTCVKSKSCALTSGRHSEWYEYVNYRKGTYDCDKPRMPNPPTNLIAN